MRGVLTRRKIAEAALSLLEEGERPPTTKQIAERAAVSHRLLSHHFKDLDTLLGVAAGVQVERYRERLAEVPSHLPLKERVELTVRQPGRHVRVDGPPRYERNGTVGPDAFGRRRRGGRARGAARPSRAHVPGRVEGGGAPASRAARRDTAVSWQVWDYLQRVNRLSPAATRRVMVKMLAAALSE